MKVIEIKVYVAEHFGYCFGVKRAVEMAIKSTEESGSRVYSLGPLIHNNQAVEFLKSKQVHVIEDIHEVENQTVIIRSHGVGKDIYDHAFQNNLKVIDATCPFVKKIQKIVHEKYNNGYNIIIIGDKDHPEVKGINGWCDNNAVTGKSIDDFHDYIFDIKTKYAVVVQTTMSSSVYDQIVEHLQGKITDAEFYNTICLATKERQQATLLLSQKVDAMVVVGGKQSSNTKKLAEISSVNCPTYLVETAKDIDEEQFKNYDSIGVSAGASTPDFIIQQVIDHLSNLQS